MVLMHFEVKNAFSVALIELHFHASLAPLACRIVRCMREALLSAVFAVVILSVGHTRSQSYTAKTVVHDTTRQTFSPPGEILVFSHVV